MHPFSMLRVEGATVFALAVATYLSLDGALWLFLALALAPDLSMLAYLAGPRLGSRVYNLAHTYTLPAVLGAAAVWFDVRVALLVAVVWAGHIGADRLAGYGLKYETGFKDTHLSTQPAPLAALTESEESD
jgi:hypothetical protein